MKDYLVVTLPFIILIPLWIFIWATIQRRRNPASKEALEAAALLSDRRWLPSGWAGMTFALVYAGAYSIRKLVPLHGALGVALLVVPALVFAWFISTLIREIRTSDEFAQRVRLEGLSYAFVTFLCFTMAMSLINEIDSVPRHGTFDASLGFLPLFYFVGLFVAKVRYMPLTRTENGKR